MQGSRSFGATAGAVTHLDQTTCRRPDHRSREDVAKWSVDPEATLPSSTGSTGSGVASKASAMLRRNVTLFNGNEGRGGGGFLEKRELKTEDMLDSHIFVWLKYLR